MKQFPQYLSSPVQIFWFESDEASIIFMLFMFACIFGGIWWIGLFVFPYLYIRAKKYSNRGFFHHFLYKYGLISFKHYPISFENKFYG